MKDQHEKISGYRDLSQAEINLMNALKGQEAAVGHLLAAVDAELSPADADECRWLSIARTHLETGFMYAIKAVARPTNGLGRNR